MNANPAAIGFFDSGLAVCPECGFALFHSYNTPNVVCNYAFGYLTPNPYNRKPYLILSEGSGHKDYMWLLTDPLMVAQYEAWAEKTRAERHGGTAA